MMLMYLLVMQDVIRREVTRCLRQAGPRKHILNIGHGVIQKTPEEGVKFFCELARQSASIHQVAAHPRNCMGHAFLYMQCELCFPKFSDSRSMPAHIHSIRTLRMSDDNEEGGAQDYPASSNGAALDSSDLEKLKEMGRAEVGLVGC